jgi:hypothetical protein
MGENAMRRVPRRAPAIPMVTTLMGPMRPWSHALEATLRREGREKEGRRKGEGREKEGMRSRGG